MKRYICPTATVLEMNCDGMLALSKIEGGVADDTEEVLSRRKGRGWNAEDWLMDQYWDLER